MAIYWVLWLFIVFFSFIGTSKYYELKILFFLFNFVLFLFIGFRFEVGGDWFNYIEMYELFKSSYSYESIFLTDISYGLINYISVFLGFDDTIFVNSICALIIILCILFSSLDFKNRWVLLLVLFPYFIIVVSMGYTRQAVAVAISFLFFKSIIDKKIIKSLILFLFAISFHKSAMFLSLFFPLLFLYKYSGFRFFVYFYYFFIFIILNFLIYYFIDYGNQYLSVDGEMQSSGFYFRMLFYFIPAILYWFYIRNKFDNYMRMIFDLFLFLFLFLLILGWVFSTLADRFSLYLMFFNFYVIGKTLNYGKADIRYSLIIFVSIFYSLYMYVWFSFGTWSSSWIPYSNYLINFISESVF
ncbi:EpsG family protein [Acinetobacter sp. ANC 4282]|uniref:EpsG family protein n=1 Tax=Acinetobacter terrae TaxID=2731247 RepID=UPI00148FDEF7|nr:EpsG family protein [Acinetobacter terrae]NNH16659.1 EpsG family protein [Acinetobacter terrae]